MEMPCRLVAPEGVRGGAGVADKQGAGCKFCSMGPSKVLSDVYLCLAVHPMVAGIRGRAKGV